jgi:D-beta-D-heptose 7-phosphate kinase / D-beta-D-heptose 1-phosphate adenosyltransferase
MIFDLHNATDLGLMRKALHRRHIGLTSGSFDLFHDLHLVYLQRCRRLCDVLIVGVDSNDLICSRKGPDRPLVSENKRVYIVSALSCVHAAFIMGSVEDFGSAVEKLGVSVIFKNEKFLKQKVLGREKAKVVYIRDVKQHDSTTEIIGEILSRRGKK